MKYINKIIIIFLFFILNVSLTKCDWWHNYTVIQKEPSTTEKAKTTTTTTTLSYDYPYHNGEPICCECMPFYMCQDGIINTDGSNLLDLRRTSIEVNVDNCTENLDVCCKPPEVHPSCDKELVSAPPKELKSDTPCICVNFDLCPDLNLAVSDGRGKTSIIINDTKTVSHSKCHKALDVCCAIHLYDDPTTPPPSTTDKNMECEECVEPLICDDKGYINYSGASVMDLRRQNICPYNDTLVCCKHPQGTSDVSNIPTKLIDTTKISQTTTTTAKTTPTDTTTTTEKTTTTNKYISARCGVRNYNGIRVRINGFKDGQAQFGEFPWVAMILRKFGNSFIYIGGGTLIHPRVILTAAHKIRGKNVGSLVVRLGEWDVRNDDEPMIHQDVSVESVIIHPKFHNTAMYHDIAILILKEEVVFTPHIFKICLAKDLNSIEHEGCVINGWGTTVFNEGRSGNYQKIMKSLEIPLVNHTKCEAQLRKTRLSRYFRLHSSFLCAGGRKGQDACKGDGGGPLVCPTVDNPLEYRLVGITAWGVGCGEENVPGVYANVINDRDWIYSIINDTLKTTTTTTTTSTQNPLFEEFKFGSSIFGNNQNSASIEEDFTTGRKSKSWKQSKKERRENRKEQRKQKRKEKRERKNMEG